MSVGTMSFLLLTLAVCPEIIKECILLTPHPCMFPSVTNPPTQCVDDNSLAWQSVLGAPRIWTCEPHATKAEHANITTAPPGQRLTYLFKKTSYLKKFQTYAKVYRIVQQTPIPITQFESLSNHRILFHFPTPPLQNTQNILGSASLVPCYLICIYVSINWMH